MPGVKTEINIIKKLKKDGSIDEDSLVKILNSLARDELVLHPVDCIFGIMTKVTSSFADSVQKLSNEKVEKIEILVSDFKMLETVVLLNKLEFDFLHRVWPGEITVLLRSKKEPDKTIPVRIPKSKFQRKVISMVKSPLIHGTLYDKKGKHIYREKDIIKTYKNKVHLITIIKEFCKEHVMPSIVNITNDDLFILKEGRVPEEEIKSLYFLGKDDVPEELYY